MNATDAVVLPAVATRDVGIPGTVYGVAETVVDDGPTVVDVTALKAIVYVVPVVKPVIETGDAVSAGEKAVNVMPPSIEYW